MNASGVLSTTRKPSQAAQLTAAGAMNVRIPATTPISSAAKSIPMLPSNAAPAATPDPGKDDGVRDLLWRALI
jgi:hypothetical protein